MLPAESDTKSDIAPVFALLIDPAAIVDQGDDVQIDIRPPANALTTVPHVPPGEPGGTLPAWQHPAYVYLASLANGSHRTMIGSLNLAAAVLTADQCDYQTCPWQALRYAHVAALRAWLLQNKSAATGNKILSAVRGTLRAAWQLGLMSTDDYMHAVAVKAIRGEKPDQAAGRALEPGEFKAVLAACAADRTPAGVRDACILGLGIVAGLRREEISGLQLADYDGRRQRLTVHGKRNKVRIVPLETGLGNALAEWRQLRGEWPGGLLCPVRKDGRILQAGISPAAVYKALQRRASEAGVEEFSPHDLRRTFAGDLLDAGADIATVQRLMGHANVATTAGYDRRGERAKQAAVGRLHMAWRRRK